MTEGLYGSAAQHRPDDAITKCIQHILHDSDVGFSALGSAASL